jgi:hypothetical protein
VSWVEDWDDEGGGPGQYIELGPGVVVDRYELLAISVPAARRYGARRLVRGMTSVIPDADGERFYIVGQDAEMDRPVVLCSFTLKDLQA